MKEIKLDRLALTNFKGMTCTIEPQGMDTDIFGANATGKTTLADAFSWLLFGKDSLGRADFEIKSLNTDGQADHGLEHGVEGALLIDGTPITLKRAYHEVWSKKRGSPQKELTGNTTDYSVDGVPIKENEYKTRVTEIFGDEATCQLLTSPAAFPALGWKKQRSLLLEICGDVSDAQVIETDSTLYPLTDLLRRYTVSKTPLDDLRKVVMSRRTEINKTLDTLPARIDEVKRGMPDVSGLNLSECRAVVANIEESLNDEKLRLQGIDNGSGIAELSKVIQGIEHEMAQLENKHYLGGMKEVLKLNEQIREITERKNSEERQVKDLKDDVATKQTRVVSLETELQILREKWIAIDAEEFSDTTEDACPTCKRPLPPEQVEDVRQKALANFNRWKAERLTKIETTGKDLRAQLDTVKQRVQELETALAERPDVGCGDIAALTTQRDELKKAAEDYSAIPGRADLIAKVAEIDLKITAARDGNKQDTDKIQAQITDLEGRLEIAKANLDKFRQCEQGEKRTKELKDEEKRLSKEFEELEKQLYLIESFIKRKVSLLNERINARFNLVRFKLFNELMNGGIEDCCEITVNGVPYNGGLNSAARTQAGLEIISALQDHYRIAPVAWIDNRESCTEIPEVNYQVVSLYVSPQDTSLRVERVRKEGRVAA